MIVKKYRIGHTTIQLNMPEIMPIPRNMQKFELEEEEYCHYNMKIDNGGAIRMHYDISIVNKFQPVVESLCKDMDVKRIDRDSVTILYLGDKECRLIRTPGQAEVYAVSYENELDKTTVWILESSLSSFIYETFFCSILSLEKLMMKEHAFVLHSAYMCKDGKAILFSAPSETGKSTQAGLWEKYRGTRNINGDRSLLIKEKDGWYAYGWPVCGSSEICNNEAYPVEAIIMLYQAKENVVTRLSGMSIIRKIMSQITINMWNREFQERAWGMLEELIQEVPVFELGCNISEEAVRCLEQALLEIEKE